MDIAKSQPLAAYAAYIHGFVHKVSYLCHTVPNIELSFQPLEDCIRFQLIATLTGQSSPCDSVRDLLGLPVRLGRLGLANPIKISSEQHKASISITAPLKDQILLQDRVYSLDCIDAQVKAKQGAQKPSRDTAREVATIFGDRITFSLQRAMELAQEKGSSSWLTSLSLEEFGFILHKGAFRDAVALRYG